MAVPVLDVPKLASFCLLPQESVNSLLDGPTTELVTALLQNVGKRSEEFEELEAAKVRSEVNLEMAVRGRESNNSALKSQLDKVREENVALRSKLESEESTKSSDNQELTDLRNRNSSFEATIHECEAKIEALEATNRDKLSLVDTKTKAYDNLVAEIESQHEKNVQTRKLLSESEQALAEERSALSAAKFKEENQKQAIEQLEKRNDYLDGELKTKSNDYIKFRKEKFQETSTLERQNEELAAKVRQLQGTETTLRRSVEEVSDRAEERSQRISSLQEEFVQKEHNFRIELDAATRLATLREHSATTDRERVRDLTEQIEAFRQNSSEEIGRIQAELETEHAAHEEAEGKVAELEVRIERLQDEIASLQSGEAVPSTPSRAVNGFGSHTPRRGIATPVEQSPSSAQLKGGLSVTRLYSENNDLKRQVIIEKRRNEELTNTMNGLVADMEEQAPQIQDLQNEHDRLESEVSELSSLIDTIGKERDDAHKALKKRDGQVEAKVKEGDILRQQLRDLSAQLKMLLIEAQLREQGRNDLTAEERAQLEQLSRQDPEDESEGSATDTDKFISLNLVPFRNIVELQNQNSKLLRLTRELGERMEHEEALRVQAESARNYEDLQHKYERCKEEMKSLVTQSQSYIRERDMFRSMLENRGHLRSGNDGSTNGENVSTQASPSQVLPSVEETHSNTIDIAEYAKMVKDMQAHFDAYRTEASTDKATLKQQLEELSKSNNELRTEASRGNNQAVLANDRYEMVKANLDMLQRENGELSRRSTEYYESVLQQDKRVQRAAEDLVESQGLVDSLRNEVANLKAENEFLKSVKARLSEDNENSQKDRSQLSSHNASLQSILNERERSESESRRRLQSQIDSLEAELRNVSSSLRAEIDEKKQMTARHEFEHEQRQTKLDEVVALLGEKREALAKATTAKEHVAREAEELKIELRSARERLEVMQNHSLPTENGQTRDASTANGSSEQDLKVRISELQRDLDLRQKDVDDGKAEIEQYKAISQASEDDLQRMNEAHDLFREDQEKLLEGKDAQISSLNERVTDMAKELGSLNQEIEELRQKEHEHQRTMDRQREELEAKLKSLGDENEARINDNDFYKEALKTQADIAQKSQSNYENELIRHAEATTALTTVRAQLEELRIKLRESSTATQTARSILSENEETWTNSKERFETEISELRAARQDLRGQNERLHQQLQKVHADQKRLTSTRDQNEGSSASSGADNLQEIVNYLRQEKEIVDTQLELSSQEAKRLKQQLSYTSSQLDEARLKAQQHSRLEAESVSSAAAHKKLMDTIQDLNMHRESNVTLRTEATQALASLAARNKELENIKGQLEPLQNQLSEIKAEREALQDEIKLEKDNAERWQQRAQSILQKYDRVDPAELEALKEQIQTLDKERSGLVSAKQLVQEQLEAASAQAEQAREQSNERVETMRSRLTEQFKGRSKQLTDRLKEKDSQIQAAATEKKTLEDKIAGLENTQAEAEAAKVERESAQANVAPMSDGEEGELNEQNSSDASQKTLQATQDKLREAETNLKAETETANSLRREVHASQSKVTELQGQMAQLETKIAELNTEIARLNASKSSASAETQSTDHAEEIAELRQALSKAQEETQQIRTNLDPISVQFSGAEPEDGSKSVAEQISEHVEAVKAELHRRHDARVQETNESFNRRIDSMKAQLSRKLAEGKQQIRESLAPEHKEALEALRSQNEAAQEQLRIRHKEEIEELKRLEESRTSELRAIWEREHADGSSTQPTPATTEAMENATPNSVPPAQLSEQEARALLKNDEVVRNIVKQNIVAQVRKSTEKLKEDHQKSISETQAKANTAKDHAVSMEGKKSQVQLNMANNKAKIAQFKLDLVDTAAQETPEKPVKAVWDSVKAARPPQASSQSMQQSPSKNAVGATSANTASSSSASTTNKDTGSIAQPAATKVLDTGDAASAEQNKQTELPPQSSLLQKPAPPATTAQSGLTEPNENGSTLSQPAKAAETSIQNPAKVGKPDSQTTQQPATKASAPPGATRPGASGLPVPRGGASRGIPRGRGSSIGRGGAGVNMTQNTAGPARRGSPGRGGINPQARQFVPVKRPREDGQEGPSGEDGSGKRMKGGEAAGGA